ncbi:MAG: TetR/AcrR family transcriptional regulator [Solirubrobacterales bacterium]|nr:TetR/AcrR family transcriptional regulator [Solirubrobacterales bacterium]
MTTRDPSATRRRLLEIGQDEIYLHGFQGASLEKILKRTGVTKGAFFHHFATKTEFGYTVVDELIAEMIAAQWVYPLRDTNDVLTTIAKEFERGAQVLRQQRPILGCPLNNLAQEMNPLDHGFRRHTLAVFDTWTASYADALDRAAASGILAPTVHPDDAAHALVAQIEGTLSLARNSQDPETLTRGTRSLRGYLESIRAT